MYIMPSIGSYYEVRSRTFPSQLIYPGLLTESRLFCNSYHSHSLQDELREEKASKILLDEEN